MTLGEFFNYLNDHPGTVLFFFLALPITAALSIFFGKGEGHLSPWKYLYSVLIYLSAIPGIFAITLNVYLFLFERQSIMQANLFTQILPVIIMFLTFYLVRKNVAFDQIPGFGRINGLISIITALIILMWILEKTHIIAFTFLPFHMVIVLFLILLLAIVLGWKRLTV
jgi:hypothetical protein